MTERKFKILVIKHQLKNNVVAESGQIVSESQLKYNVSELLQGGYIEEVLSEETKPNEVVSPYAEMTKKELIQFAKDNNIEIDPKAKVDVIVEAIENHVKSLEVE